MIIISVTLICLIAIIYYTADFDNFSPVAITLLLIIALLVNILTWAETYSQSSSMPSQREAYVYSLEMARANDNPLEEATITKEIIQWNSELKEMQYWNSIWIFNSYFNDNIEDLQMIN